MTTFPVAGYISNAGRTVGEVKAAEEDILAATKQIPGAGVAETTLTIAAGVITPTSGGHRVDTEAAASTDDLTNIAQTNLPDGSMLLIRSLTASRLVVLKQAAGGAGQMSFTTAQDVTLRHPLQWVLLKRGGGQWEEVGRFGFHLPQERSRLEYVSTTSIKLEGGVVPLSIGGTWWLRQIPDAGITVSNTGLAASTLYFIYAVASGATTALVVTTDGPVFVDGVWVRNGFQDHTLVGAVYTNASTPGQFQSTGAIYGVSSWFSRKQRSVTGLSTSATTASASAVAIGTAASFIKWADDYADYTVQAHVRNSGAAQIDLWMYVNAVQTAFLRTDVTGGATARDAVTVRAAGGGTTGLYVLQPEGSTSAGTATYEELRALVTFRG